MNAKWRVYFLSVDGARVRRPYKLFATKRETLAVVRAWNGTAIVRTADTYPGCFAAKYVRGVPVARDPRLWRARS